jgi:hypothetical protein
LTIIGKKIDIIRSNTANSGEPTYTTHQGELLTHFNPVNSDQIIHLIKAASCKQCVLDPAPTWLIKDTVNLLAPFITAMLNRSLIEGHVPASQKTAVVKPLLKKCGLDSTLPANYRPVANLTFMSKILEKIIDEQLTSHLHRINAFHSRQSAYLKHRSTETGLLRIHTDICSHLDNGNAVLLGSLDMSTAFDTVDHNILLTRLRVSYGITDSALQWFASYLSGRKYSVIVMGKASNVYIVICGVPQGSVLGPKLFILYTSSLESLVNQAGFDYHSYADDTQVYKQCLPTQEHVTDISIRFAACLDTILQWMMANRLQLNPDKTECVWFRSAGCNFQDFPDLSVGPVIIHPSSYIRCLGVHLDQHLRLDHQITAVSKASYFQLRQLKSISKNMDSDTIRSVLQAFLCTRLDYCSALYYGLPTQQINRLQRIQNSAARLFSGSRKRDHIRPVLRELHWLPVEYRIRYKIAVIVYMAWHHHICLTCVI